MTRSSKYDKKRLIFSTIAIEIMIIMALFLFSANFIEKNLEDDIQRNMLSIARYGAQKIYTVGLELIQDENDFFFTEIKKQLQDIEKVFHLRKGFVYIVELNEGKPVFSVMTHKTPFRGHEYPKEIAHRIHQVYGGKEIVSDLYEDRNGTFISVIVPLYNQNKVIAALEIDLPGEDYQQTLHKRLIPFLFGIFILLLIAFTVIFIVLLKLYNAREKEFRQNELHLIQSEKMNLLNRLVSGIAHEINSPIGAINSTVDILNRSIEKISTVVENGKSIQEIQENKSYQKSLEIFQKNNQVIVKATKRISTIVNSLMDLARVDEADFKKADINKGLNSALTLIQHELKDRIEIQKEYGELPSIYCYPNQLNQMFMSLLVNAAQAIEEKGIIKIVTYRDKTHIVVQITDSGKGIPEDKLSKLFDLQFTTKNSKIHLGTGLAIACNVIQKHQGMINVVSEVGKGTDFIITLPVDLNDES